VRYVTIARQPLALFDPVRRQSILTQELGRAALDIVEGIATQARRVCPVDQGRLRASIQTGVHMGVGASLVATVSAGGPDAPYARPVEFGSRPHWAPIAPLKAWARRVLGHERAGYAVQRVIARRGTRARPFFGPAVLQGQQRIPSVFAQAERRIVERLQT